MVRGSLLTVLTLAVAGCASRDLWPVERVDPDTAVHLTIMAEPWIYVLDDPRYSANASDFLDVTVVETNRTGTRSYWLNAVAWSTSTRNENAAAPATGGPAKLLLTWPGRQAQFACAAEGRAAAAVGEAVIATQGARSSEAWCPLSAAQVRELGAGAPNAVSLIDEAGRTRSYASWQVENTALAEFLKATGAATN